MRFLLFVICFMYHRKSRLKTVAMQWKLENMLQNKKTSYNTPRAQVMER